MSTEDPKSSETTQYGTIMIEICHLSPIEFTTPRVNPLWILDSNEVSI